MADAAIGILAGIGALFLIALCWIVVWVTLAISKIDNGE